VTATLPDRLLAQVPGADVTVRAPGRANLIGEHTDYNDGLVLPLALDLETVLVGRRADGVVRLRSLDADGVAEVDLRTGAGSGTGWGRYVTAVARVLLDAGLPVRGVDGVVGTTLPVGAGLSSSAALELAVALALLEDDDVDRVELARLCQRAENEGVGVATGLMDQLACACGVEGCALLLDCRAVTVEPVPLPPGLAVLLVDSAVPRALQDTAYADRRRDCSRAAAALGVPALRDATEADLDRLDDPVLRRRTRHVVTENARVTDAVDALRADDRPWLGELFAASQASMRDDYETSVPQVDLLVDLAVGTDGVVASRLTGGGFGGCTVQLVEAERAEQVRRRLLAAYVERTGLPARAWVSRAGAGASRLAG
jgi:galactokinase